MTITDEVLSSTGSLEPSALAPLPEFTIRSCQKCGRLLDHLEGRAGRPRLTCAKGEGCTVEEDSASDVLSVYDRRITNLIARLEGGLAPVTDRLTAEVGRLADVFTSLRAEI